MKKIAWVTPFTKKSAIANISKQVTDELQKYYVIDIFTDTKNDLFDTNLNVRVFSKHSDVNLSKYDYIVYQIGNFAGFHRSCYDLLKKYGGIVIQHDQTMSGFFCQYFLFEDFGGNHITGVEPYRNIISKYYGTEGEKILDEAFNINLFPVCNQGKMPQLDFLKEIFSHASGIFTHAKFFTKKITEISNVPVGYSILPLSSEYSDIDIKERDIIFNLFKRDKSKLLIMASGIVHPIKRIDKIVDIILSNEDIKSNVQFIVIGSYGGEYGDNLYLLSQGKLKNILFMLGYQDDAMLRSAIYNADICVNLRYPNSEVCSLSILEQMVFGKPCIVLGSGFFGELPDNAVLRTNLQDETRDILSYIRNAIDNKDCYKEVGLRAKQFILDECNVEKYVEQLNIFLTNLDIGIERSKLENSVIDNYRKILDKLHFSEEFMPMTITQIVNNIFSILGNNVNNVNGTLALWFGFQHPIPNLKREGITRFAAYLAKAFIDYYNINIEIWYYSFNDGYIKESFDRILSDEKIKNKVKLCHEQMYDDGSINADDDNLYIIAKKYSNADVFMPAILYLDNVCGVDKKIVVPAHDMAVSEHYLNFIERDILFKARTEDIVARANNLARNGAIFFSNTNYVIENQILKYIRCLKKENTRQIYLPVNIQQNIISDDDKILFNNKYRLDYTSMFYPTQIRPYKNITLLLNAISILKAENYEIKLILTGNIDDVASVKETYDKLDIEDHVICVNGLSETELSFFYKNAYCVAVPSLFEGGFPYQALEALHFDIPLAIADIPVTRERIESVGLTYETCGLEIFNPNDEVALANAIKKILSDRDAAVKSQRILKDKLLGYTWKEASKEYYEVFFGN